MKPARLIVGLGNPGEAYADTRHNLGFRVVERLARRRGIVFDSGECASRVGSASGLLLALPQTFMNRSGFAVRCLAARHELEPEAILVVYDDVALPLGALRLRARGGPGGHRGMESVIENLRSDAVARLRLGIEPEPSPDPGAESDLSDFVLSPFEPSELEAVEDLLSRAEEGVGLWLDLGTETAMNRING